MVQTRSAPILHVFPSLLIAAVLCSLAFGRIIYVDDDAAQVNDGTSWTRAYGCLQDALAVARSGDEVRVAQGTYTPDRRVVIGRFSRVVASGDRAETFRLASGVAILGGYAGLKEPDPNARDIDLYETILCGDLKGNDVDARRAEDLLNEPTRADNSYAVVTSIGTDGSGVIEGFTITGGNANGSGGGINCARCAATISRNTIVGNSALEGGGGIGLAYSSSVVVNNTIIANAAGPHKGGGGIYCGEDTTATIAGNTIKRNFARERGGGVCCHVAAPTLLNNLIALNQANTGGGMENHTSSHPALTNCTFSDNYAYNWAGGIYNDQTSTAALANCILWGNTTPQVEGVVSILYSAVQDGWPGAGNIDTDPYFASRGYWAHIDDPNIGTQPGDPNAVCVDGDYHLRSEAGRWDPVGTAWVHDAVTSPCIDSGDPNALVAEEPVPNGGRINMGVYGGTAEASMSPAYICARYGGGTGTPHDPYQIRTPEHMNAIGAAPGDLDKHFRLMADIDLRDYRGDQFNVVGIAWNRNFKGTFDGNGHTISNVTYRSTAQTFCGLFGYVDDPNAEINCFWDLQTSGQVVSAGGTGKTTAEMQTAATFLEAGWDVVGETANGTEDIWWIPEGLSPPVVAACPAMNSRNRSVQMRPGPNQGFSSTNRITSLGIHLGLVSL